MGKTRSVSSTLIHRIFAYCTGFLVLVWAAAASGLALANRLHGLPGAALILLPVLIMGCAFFLVDRNERRTLKGLKIRSAALQENNLELIETLGAVVDAYDPSTYGHSAQVAVYAGALAQKIGLSEDEQEQIVKAALIHDIGKIGIPESIIRKPGPLTEEEYELVRRHPSLGAEIVGRMKELKGLVPLIRSHHERYDGSGYPDRLTGAEIPLGVRILTLADSLEPMLSDRPYRPARELALVIDEVVECSGKQFDPRVTQAFLELAAEKGPLFFRSPVQTIDRDMLLVSAGAIASGARRFLKRSHLR